jgi:hypothetical protein
MTAIYLPDIFYVVTKERTKYFQVFFCWQSGLIDAKLGHNFGDSSRNAREDVDVVMTIQMARSSLKELDKSLYLLSKLFGYLLFGYPLIIG